MGNRRNKSIQDRLLDFPLNEKMLEELRKQKKQDKRKWINLMDGYFRVVSFINQEEFFIRDEFFEKFAYELDKIFRKWQNKSFSKEFQERFRYKADEPSEDWQGRDIL